MQSVLRFSWPVHDNARHHVARVWKRFLEDESIDTIDWPTRYLDLNPSSTSGTSWINTFGGFQTHSGHSRSSPTPWLGSGKISILGHSVGLPEAWTGVVERSFRHVGVEPSMCHFNMIEWIVAILGQIHISIITLFFVMISGISRQMVIPLSPWPVLLSCAPDR